MKKFTIFFLLFSMSFSAQIKGVVKDSISGKPIPYVNIWVENENIGTTSEENGSFSLDVKKEKVLFFSALGYETKKTSSTKESVFLTPIVYQLDNVVISKLKNTKQIEIGDSKKRFYLPEPQNTPWIFARKIKFDVANADAKYLKTLIYYVKSELDSANFRVRLFSVSKKDLPEEDLLSNEIIVQVKKGNHKIEVDMSSFKIIVPEEGIIVGFESLFIEENKYTEKFSTPKSSKILKNDNYDPHILYQYINSESSYTFRTGIWIKQQMHMNQDWKNDKKVIAPVINAILIN